MALHTHGFWQGVRSRMLESPGGARGGVRWGIGGVGYGAGGFAGCVVWLLNSTGADWF